MKRNLTSRYRLPHPHTPNKLTDIEFMPFDSQDSMIHSSRKYAKKGTWSKTEGKSKMKGKLRLHENCIHLKKPRERKQNC